MQINPKYNELIDYFRFRRQEQWKYFAKNEHYMHCTYTEEIKHFNEEGYGYYHNYIQKLLDTDMRTDNYKNSFITALALNNELGLLAIGTSDGRIIIYDITTIKFMQ